MNPPKVGVEVGEKSGTGQQPLGKSFERMATASWRQLESRQRHHITQLKDRK
ncbi:hypothetical protein Dimus_001478, partial [Dionaea muscipula]